MGFCEKYYVVTTLEMKNKSSIILHLMIFKAFNNLVLKLTLFLQSQCMDFVRPQLEIKYSNLCYTCLLVESMPNTWLTDLM
jgi:hypothetical protein